MGAPALSGPYSGNAWICFPGLVIYLLLMSLIGAGLLQLILVLGISGGIGGSRLMRSAVIAIKENVYVKAARAIGASTWRILGRHLLPNIVPIVIVRFTLGMAGVILAEASLSFLGFGIPPPTPSWGGMLNRSGRAYMEVAPWLALARSQSGYRGIWYQHAGRRLKRFTRPASEGRSGAL